MIKKEDEFSRKIIEAAIEVHRNLGPGLLESAYEECLCREMAISGLAFERQKSLPIFYKGVKLDCGYRLDVCCWRIGNPGIKDGGTDRANS